MKILVIGGGVGTGRDVVNYFDPNSRNVSRSTGFDINISEDRNRIVEISLDYDAVLNHAHAGGLSQSMMLRYLYLGWSNHKKSGYIFHTGTYATFSLSMSVEHMYAAVKSAGDVICRQISKQCENNREPFRLTNLRPAMLDTAKSRLKPHWEGNGIRGEDYAKIIEFLYNLPEDVCIPEMVMMAKHDPI